MSIRSQRRIALRSVLIAALLSLQPLAAIGRADTPAVFAANYDLILVANETRFQATSKARVASGSPIPVDFGRFRVDMKLSAAEADKVVVRLEIYERSNGAWYAIEADGLAFEAELVSPVAFEWESAGLEIDLALIVSEAPSRTDREAD